jgi:hypothetical protein
MTRSFRFAPALGKLAMACGAVLTIAACTKKVEVPPITGLDTYDDKVANFSIQYPKNWKAAQEAGKSVTYYSNDKILERFNGNNAYGESELAGAKVGVTVTKLDAPLTNLDSVINNSKIFEDPSIYAPLQDVQLDGVKAKKLSYAVKYEDGEFKGEKYFAMKDSTALTIVEFEAFGGSFDQLKPKFDEMLKATKLAYFKPVVRDTAGGKPAETFKASETLASYDGSGYSIGYPNNFSAKNVGGGVQFQGIGGPSDCIINISVADAAKQGNLTSIINQNKKLYKAESSTNTQLGGNEAAYIEDTPVKDVRRRTYFSVKGGKLYKVTLQWFKPEQEFFLPVFEKSLASFKFQ